MTSLAAACERFVLVRADRAYQTLSYYKQLTDFADLAARTAPSAVHIQVKT